MKVLCGVRQPWYVKVWNIFLGRKSRLVSHEVRVAPVTARVKDRRRRKALRKFIDVCCDGDMAARFGRPDVTIAKARAIAREAGLR
ncbi:hypothetical protein FACS1894187_10510 [Synergistales bacterium]|nr:hypothetical protein FACS1894187_10510 [Synergistales bacterium]